LLGGVVGLNEKVGQEDHVRDVNNKMVNELEDGIDVVGNVDVQARDHDEVVNEDAHGQAGLNAATMDDVNVAANVDVQNGDDSAVENGYEVLDESEEEVHRDIDDYFGCNDTPRRNIRDVLQRWSNMRKNRRKRKLSTSASAGGFETPQFGGNHDMDATYSTNELQSDMECEGEEVQKNPMFKADNMGRDFKFCLGMEFCSLKKFKQALKEYSALNGRKVISLKNDDIRVRAICKKKSGFLILCSKVGGSHTFWVKTLVDSHSCGRVFANRNANKDWVSKIVADKYKNVG